MKTKFKQLSVFYNDDDVLNRRIYTYVNDYDTGPFSQMQIVDVY